MTPRIVGFVFSSAVAAITAWVSVSASTKYIRDIGGFEGWKPFRYFDEIYTGLFAALGIIVGFTVASLIYRQALDLYRDLLSDLRRIPARDKAAVILGIFMGLATTALLGRVLVDILDIGGPLILLVGVICVYLGVAITTSMKEELYYFFPGLSKQAEGGAEEMPAAQPKLLDTNVIIDGRITDICRAGFCEGPLYVPDFVLNELHLISDSSDTLKRNRGRRGLDILNQMQQESSLHVRVYDRYDQPLRSSDPVDTKLVHLAQDLGAAIVTNDFNLNKVAQLQGIKVLNVNELANAVKPVVLPGEQMTVTVVREGKEQGQGVAYLEDGTMVVVESGKNSIGETVGVVVTSVLQTVAGKMIFGDLQGVASRSQEGSDRHHRANSRGGTRRKARSQG